MYIRAAKYKPVVIKDPYKVIMYPYVTEKMMMLIEKSNSLAFIVKDTSTKNGIKQAVEKLFECKVKAVNTQLMKHGKLAIVSLEPEFSASDIGMRIGIF